MVLVKAECGCSFDITYSFRDRSTLLRVSNGINNFVDVKSTCEKHTAEAREEGLTRLKERHAKELAEALE